MNESTALALSEPRALTPQIWAMIKDMAPVMHQSRLFGVSSVEQAAAIMLKGHEVGFGFAASFDMIQVIQGKPAVSPRGALALIMNCPEITDIKINRLAEAKGAFIGYECSMTRKGKLTYTTRFTMDDAKRAGLIKQDSGWDKYPENMCLWRAIGFCCDVVAPDITSGLTGLMKMPEQFGVALTPEGDIIDLQVNDVKPAPVTVYVPKRQKELTLTELVSLFAPEAIMAANDGVIPRNQDEINAVVAKLSGSG